MPPWLPYAIAFPVLWVAILWVVGTFAGWGNLAKNYRFINPFHGTRRRFRSLSFGSGCNYNGCVTVGTNADGLYLAVPLPFRPGHPPLFVPWADVTATPRKQWRLFSVIDFRFANAPGVTVTMPEGTAREIAADANRTWAKAESE